MYEFLPFAFFFEVHEIETPSEAPLEGVWGAIDPPRNLENIIKELGTELLSQIFGIL